MKLYEENNGTGNVMCELLWGDAGALWNFVKHENATCNNDDARSAVIVSGVKGTKIGIYDSPWGHNDDYTIITILKDLTEPVLIHSFEKNITNEFLEVAFYKDTDSIWFLNNGLDGKVSKITVDTSGINVDGGWSDWEEWGSCSTTCDEGVSLRYRSCNSPVKAYGGRDCQGQMIQRKKCQISKCAIDGGWTDFSDWSACSQTCGVGSTTRSRTCSNPLPQFGGDECVGNDTETKSCVEIKNCPISGGWGRWTQWGECSLSCGLGKKKRTRVCDNPLPQYGGQTCPGNWEEKLTCSQLTFCSGSVTLYSGNGGKGDVVCELGFKHENEDFDSIKMWNFMEHNACENNVASSLVINQANAGTTIGLYDDPEGNKDYDYTTIKIKKDISEPLIINTFEKSYSDDMVDVHFGNFGTFGISWLGDGLDGEVSNVFVVTP
jgi:hypothetical protein